MGTTSVFNGFPVFSVSPQSDAKTVSARRPSSTAPELRKNRSEGNSSKPDAAAVNAMLAGRGMELRADDGRLIVTPAHLLTDELRELIRTHKTGIIALLATPVPPPLTADEQTAIEERLEERAAILEFDGGESRPVAESQAKAGMCVYRIRVAMGPGELDKWTTLLAPGCDVSEATRVAQGQFGADRVLQVIEHSEATT